MADEDSFLKLREGLERGDSDCEIRLWEMYVDKLVRLARRYLTRQRPVDGDSEGAVVSGMNSFYRWIKKHPGEIDDQEHLQALLAKFIFRKCRRQDRSRTAEKRGANAQVQPFDEYAIPGRESLLLDELIVQEVMDELLDGMSDDQRMIFELTMDGESKERIAAHTKRSVRTVERFLDRVEVELRVKLGGESAG